MLPERLSAAQSSRFAAFAAADGIPGRREKEEKALAGK